MARCDTTQCATVTQIESEIERIQSLGLDDLRSLWRETFKKGLPSALTRSLIVWTLAWRIQEKAFGGHDRATLKNLKSYARGKPADASRLRHLKPGTELVREYQGRRHTVTITGNGFSWAGRDYDSLSAIARAITGSNWNGPRFFGLRVSEDRPAGPPGRPPSAGNDGAARGGVL